MNAPISFIRKTERPPSLANVVVLGQADANAERLRLPLFLSRISAGFPSPADDYVEGGCPWTSISSRGPRQRFSCECKVIR